MRSESAANMAMAEMVKQDRLDEQRYQVKLANDAARKHEAEKNRQFWHSIKSVVIAILLAATAIYLLIHWG